MKKIRRLAVVLKLVLAGALSLQCLGRSSDSSSPQRKSMGDAGTQPDGGQASGNRASCATCTVSSQCASNFCNAVTGSAEGRCSTRDSTDSCDCVQGTLSGGVVCTGPDCPPGDPVTLCTQLSGDELGNALDGDVSGNGSAGVNAGGSAGSGGAAGFGGNGVGGAEAMAGAAGTGGGPGVGSVGAPCAVDVDCRSGLTCLRADGTAWLAGGPANGYCTVSCAADPSICDTLDGSVCIPGADATEAYCMEGCTRGASFSPFDFKCHRRPDVACMQVTATLTGCMPMCGSDNQCPPGRHCDWANGVCVDAVHQGDPPGAPCQLNALTNTCDGVCLDLGDGLGTCSGLCIFGIDRPSCGFDPAQDTVVPGSPVCLVAFDPNDSLGDAGVCVARCDCDGQCLSATNVCSPFGNSTSQQLAQAVGYCIPTVNVGGPGVACSTPDGG